LGAALVLVLAAGPAIAANVNVSIVDRVFDPGGITVTAGDTVVWTVTSALPEGHTVTSGRFGDADAGKVFDSGVGLTENGQTFEHTFTEPGNYGYFCQIHGAFMSGTVLVLEAGASEAPDGSQSAAPGESAAPGQSAPPAETAAPSASEGASESPGGGPHEAAQIPADRRLLAGGVLLVAIVVMFGAAAVWRRVNPG
jgi:plastocyanin